jgi:hypothetical protein
VLFSSIFRNRVAVLADLRTCFWTHLLTRLEGPASGDSLDIGAVHARRARSASSAADQISKSVARVSLRAMRRLDLLLLDVGLLARLADEHTAGDGNFSIGSIILSRSSEVGVQSSTLAQWERTESRLCRVCCFAAGAALWRARGPRSLITWLEALR